MDVTELKYNLFYFNTIVLGIHNEFKWKIWLNLFHITPPPLFNNEYLFYNNVPLFIVISTCGPYRSMIFFVIRVVALASLKYLLVTSVRYDTKNNFEF